MATVDFPGFFGMGFPGSKRYGVTAGSEFTKAVRCTHESKSAARFLWERIHSRTGRSNDKHASNVPALRE
jgi:hypothetical protein